MPARRPAPGWILTKYVGYASCMLSILYAFTLLKKIVLTIVIVMSFQVHGGEAGALDAIDELNWKHRIVIVDPSKDAQAVSAELSRCQYEIDDRDIVWFIIEHDRVVSNYRGELSAGLRDELRNRLAARPGRVILIGKDGGTKASYDRFDLEAIFTAIDAMPMRQIEMLE